MMEPSIKPGRFVQIDSFTCDHCKTFLKTGDENMQRWEGVERTLAHHLMSCEKFKNVS